MSNMHNEQTNEKIYEEIFDEVLEQDSKGLLETEIRDMQLIYNLHQLASRDFIQLSLLITTVCTNLLLETSFNFLCL